MGYKDYNSPHVHPTGLFDTEEEAEIFALKFATDYIDGRDEVAQPSSF
jgi:hypothetical protein